MKTKTLLSLTFLCLSGTLIFFSCKKNDDTPAVVVKPDILFHALTSSNQLVKYNANSETAISTVAVTGLQTGENLMAIDYRPATGQMYGLGNTSRIYIINQETGKATVVGATPFSPIVSGSLVGFDFNPTVDRIRVVTSSGQNLRIHPETGAVAAVDANLNPGSPNVSGAAYTNSVSGASTTVLYDIDITASKLYKQEPPNNGTLVEVGPLGVGTITGDGGFDISPDNTVALASFNIGGVSGLHQIDLTTGKATKLGNIGSNVIGIAIPTAPVAYAADDANNLLIFNLKTPGIPVSKAITGLQTGETILGIDMRPATGQLFALGSTSRLYTINMSSGAAAVVGAQLPTLLSGTAFGFDFNPTVDRIRVISNTGQNLRLNPNDGTIAATDAVLNPGTPMVSAAAYTNNFPGSTATVLYDIDPATDKLYMQNPPNNGTLVEVGALGVNVDDSNGFDIGGTSNNAYALLRVGGVTKIYSINITSGAATAYADFSNYQCKGLYSWIRVLAGFDTIISNNKRLHKLGAFIFSVQYDQGGFIPPNLLNMCKHECWQKTEHSLQNHNLS